MSDRPLVSSSHLSVKGNFKHDSSVEKVSLRMETTQMEQDVAKLIVQTLKLKVDPSTIDAEQALFGDGLGLDSIDALELSLAISQTYGYQLRSNDPDIKTTFSSLRALTQAIESNRTK